MSIEDKLAALGRSKEVRRRESERHNRLMKILIFFMIFGYPIGYGLGLLILHVFFRKG